MKKVKKEIKKGLYQGKKEMLQTVNGWKQCNEKKKEIEKCLDSIIRQQRKASKIGDNYLRKKKIKRESIQETDTRVCLMKTDKN